MNKIEKKRGGGEEWATSTKRGGLECEGTRPGGQRARDEEHSHAGNYQSRYAQHYSRRNITFGLRMVEGKRRRRLCYSTEFIGVKNDAKRGD